MGAKIYYTPCTYTTSVTCPGAHIPTIALSKLIIELLKQRNIMYNMLNKIC